MIARASEWTSGEVAAATAGHLEGTPDRRILGVATDTRDALAGQLFVALVGARFDAHDFLEKAVDQGAAALLVRRGALDATRLAALSARASVIAVDDTLRGLGLLAKAHRMRLGLRHPRIVGLTGSNGKTSTKEMLAAVLAQAGDVHKTEGNLNNWIGMPLTLLGVRKEHEFAVLEMGMNALGEIAWMTSLAMPEVGLVTNIGPAHVGELGGMDNVAKAKGELFAGLLPGATAVVNLDDERVVLQASLRNDLVRRTFGRAADADVRVVSSVPAGDDGQQLTLAVDGASATALLPYPGLHNAVNAAGAVAAATAAAGPLDLGQIARGLAAAERTHGRLDLARIGPWTVVDDAYNANGASMIAAIDTVSARVRAHGGRFVAVLGEMRELGAYSDEEHARVGRALGPAGCAVLASFGRGARPLSQAALVPRVLHEDDDDRALFDWLRRELADGDVILVKGSRGIRMERFIERLQEVAR